MTPYKPASRLPLPNPTAIDFADPESLRVHLVALNAALAELSSTVQMKTEPQSSLLMRSPNGSVYRQSISDAGVWGAVVPVRTVT